MKFRDIHTGAVYEPNETVAEMMKGNPNLELIDEKPEKKAAPRKRAVKPKE